MTRVAVIGTGFAGLTAARTLRVADPKLEITLISPRPELVYLPSLIWIPTGQRKPEDLVIPLAAFLSRTRVQHYAGTVTGLRDGGRVVVTDAGEVENDGLIIASGGQYLKKLPGIEHAVVPCEGVAAAVAIRDRIAALEAGTLAFGFAGNPNEPTAMRGGPMFELLLGTHTHLQRQGRRKRFKLLFFSPAAEPGKRLGPRAVNALLGTLARRGIDTHLGHKLKRFAADRIVTEGGEVAADLIVFMPGVTGNAWLDGTDLPRSPGGLLKADAQCRVEGTTRVYVAGDAGSFPGPEWMPKQAHMADLQAVAAAGNLLTELRGGQPAETFKVELVCIVDSANSGMLVVRTPRRSFMLPPSPLLHWAKRAFEWQYLRKYR